MSESLNIPSLQAVDLEENKEEMQHTKEIEETTTNPSTESTKEDSEEVSAPQELYSMPTVDLTQKAISKDALKKLHHENFIHRFHDPNVKQSLVERFFENEVAAYKEKNGYDMSGKQKRAVKRRLSTMYDKGKFNKFLKDSVSLN